MTDSVAVLPPGWRALDANGDVVSGAILEFFESGTTTPLEVFSDSDLSTSLGTSITCDAGGYPTSDGNSKTLIYSGTAAYKVRLRDADDTTTIWEHDEVRGALDTSDFLTDPDITVKRPVVNTSSNVTIGSTHKGKTISVNCTGGDKTVTFPAASTLGDNFNVRIKHAGTANRVLIVGTSSETFAKSGATVTAFALVGLGETVDISCDGTGWHVDGRSPAYMDLGVPVIPI